MKFDFQSFVKLVLDLGSSDRGRKEVKTWRDKETRVLIFSERELLLSKQKFRYDTPSIKRVNKMFTMVTQSLRQTSLHNTSVFITYRPGSLI